MRAEPGRARVVVRTLGCKVNRTESEAIAEELLERGAVLTEPGAADVVVINTCTVTGEADAKARKAIRGALACDGRPIVIVTGCLAAIDPEGVAALGERVVVEADRARVIERVRELVGGLDEDAAAGTAGEPAPAPAATFRTRATVKIQDGCDHRCSYCIVPDARGSARSVPAEDVVGRVADLVARGTREVVLTGINIGRYADPGARDLAALVERVAASGVSRIRLSSIEPLDLTDRLLSTLAATPAVMPHLHVPLQSGCDRQLGAMRRGYDAREFGDAIRRAREALSGLAVTTDVIAGFPGETEADAAESLAFVESCAFAKLHVFRYSRRAGTPAASMPEQVEPRAKAARADAMRRLGERLAAEYAASRVGGEAAMLVERASGGDAIGTSEDHLAVRVRGAAALATVGDVIVVRLVLADAAAVEGVPIP